MTPEPVGTPYGVEGYKTIAHEVYFQLGERFPSRMLVPTSGGDAIYGPWKGFRELEVLGAPGPLPRMVAVKAPGCDPIVRGGRPAPPRCHSIRIHGRSRCRSPTRRA